MKLWERLDNLSIALLKKTIDLQKKQIKIHKQQVKNHEVLIKQLMQELGYPSWKIKATILANYRNENIEDNSSTKK